MTKKIYAGVVGTILLVMVAPVALADPGTTWDTKITGAKRFSVLGQFDRAAVLDKETGRVWEQSPSTSTFSWIQAATHCYQRELGGRKGWRLPTIEELASLVDTSQSEPTLPVGHPFSNVQSFNAYWSATSAAGDNAWAVVFFNGEVGVGLKIGLHLTWCVRGGQGTDGVQ